MLQTSKSAYTTAAAELETHGRRDSCYAEPTSTSPAPAAIVDADATATPPRGSAATHCFGPTGPSFDCARASTRVEDMLCTDADLAAHDRRAAALYFALRNTLPPELQD